MTTCLQQHQGENWKAYNGDSVEMIAALPDNSIDYIIFSPPFSSLYTYSASERDMGNTSNHGDFWQHYSYLSRELYRVLRPGRLMSVHCMLLPLTKQHDGVIGLYDFRGDVIRLHQADNFIFHSEVVIWKDPVTAMQRTKAIGLLHKQMVKDSAMSRQSVPDYLVTLRKPGQNEEPIAGKFHEYIGLPETEPATQDEDRYSIEVWQRYASPVWMDINLSDTLQYTSCRADQDEKHICLARGTLVLTYEHGYIPIEEVSIGDQVLTHQGRWKPVTAKQCNGIRPVIQTKAQGVPYLKTTPDHKLWTRKARTKHPRKIAKETAPDWVPASDTLSSYVNLKLPPIEPSPISTDTWWLIGRWLGDGCYDARGHILISCGNHKKEALLQRLGDKAGRVNVTGSSCVQIGIKDRSGELRKILNNFGTGASGKFLPGCAVSLDQEKSEALLSGYLSADGHYTEEHDRWSATSVSRPLLLGMALVAQRARGVVASVYAGRKSREHTIEGRTVLAQDEWIMSIPPKNMSAMMLDDGAWKKVRSLCDANEEEVWDIAVADDASFTAEGCIVKNCPLQLDVIRRALAIWTNEGDTVLTPFGGIGSEAYVALEQRRKAVLMELKQEYYEQAIKNLEAMEFQAAQPTLFDLLAS